MPLWLTVAACTSMRPPGAISRPRFTTSPAPAFSLTLTLGVAVSTSSTLEPAASTTCPPGALISPSLRTVPPMSAMRQPRVVRSSPWLTMPAGFAPSCVKRWLPFSQSRLLRFNVDVTSPATSTRAPWPNSTPFGFNSHTWPLLLRLPRIDDGSLPVTRLSTLLLGPICWKRTALAAPIENVFQLMIAFGELVTLNVLPAVWAVTCPLTTFMPVGSTCARRSAAPGQNVNSEQAASARTSRCGEACTCTARAARLAMGRCA